jgi:hypothetical protein
MARRQYPAIAMEKTIRGIFGTLLEEKMLNQDWSIWIGFAGELATHLIIQWISTLI